MRRYFSFCKRIPKEENEKFKIVLTQKETEELLKKTDIILPKKRKYYIENLYSHYEHTMYIEPLDETRRIIEEKCPEYKEKISNSTSKAYQKASEIIKKGAKNINDFAKNALGDENYQAIIDAKDELAKYSKEALNFVTGAGSKVFNETKDKLNEWYQNFKNQ